MNRRHMLVSAGAAPFDTLWDLLETDKSKFVEIMQKEQKVHDERLKANPWSGVGSPEYAMMQEVWTEFHRSGGKRTFGTVSELPTPVIDDGSLPIEPELPKMQWRTLALAGATPFERTWGQLATDKPAFIAKMRVELKKHREWKALHPETPTGGNNEYMMMHWVWHHYHENGEVRVPPPHLRDIPPPPPRKPCAGQSCNRDCPYCFPQSGPVGVYAVNPATTHTRSHEQVVQWAQGGRIVMRPVDREVMPGEQMASVHVLRKG